jgi:hypothetical protein
VRGHNPLKYTFDVVEDFIVPESDDRKASALKILRPPIVVVVPFRMLATIQLDDQSPFKAAEVDDERVDLILAVKLQAARSSISQASP